MSQLSLPKWAVSLADLGLLLLGFFLLLHVKRPDMREVAKSVRAVPVAAREVDVLNVEAARLFEDGEARLTQRGRLRLRQIGMDAAAQAAGLSIESGGLAPDARRFDGWELAAARAAAAARVVMEAGVGEEKVRIIVPEAVSGDGKSPQRLVVRLIR